MSVWVPSPNFDPGRPGTIRWVVWHSTEGQEVTSSAYDVASGWFALDSAQVSAHVVVDDGSDPRYPDGVVECVKPGDTAWHCGPAGNPYGYGIEIVGQAAQTLAQWSDTYSTAALHHAVKWVLSVPVLAALPRRFLADSELSAGASGHITHAQVSRVLGGTTHTDPGPNFPFSTVETFLNGAPPVSTTDDNVALLVAQMVTGNDPAHGWGWDAWAGGSTTGGKPDRFTVVDYLRKANQRHEDILRALATVSTKVDEVSAAVAAVSVGGVDLDALAAKVADLLSARLAA